MALSLSGKEYAAMAGTALPPIVSESWQNDPKHLGFVLARYKFAGRMLSGLDPVAEIGAGEGFASRVAFQFTGYHHVYDKVGGVGIMEWDICRSVLPHRYRGIFAIDVLEHIEPDLRHMALMNIRHSLRRNGVFVAGCPSLESQEYASPRSKEGHVSCMTGDMFRAELGEHFDNVFMFGMNDEVLHTGFMPFCQYLFALCVGPK